VVYICLVIDSLPRSPIAVYAARILVLAALVVGVGCGGGGDSGETGSTSAGTSPTASQPRSPATKVAPKATRSSPKERSRSTQSTERASEKAARAQRRAAAIRHGAARNCPAGVTVAQCESLAEEVAEKDGSSAPPMEKPNDCLEVMSRAQCEALLAAQQAAAESGNKPVNIERCLEDPTPRCREVLESMAEDQHLTPQSAGE
jgi:hypothetical protein